MALILIRPFFRIKYIGRENVPKSGFVLCSNHISYFDPVILGFGFRRKIHFMAKSEFFTGRGFFVSFFMKACGVFPVKRNSADLKSADKASELLSAGKIVGIFPQGKIVRKIDSFEPKAGAALIAAKTGAGIIPVSIYTEGKIRLFSRITVRISEPFYTEGATLRDARAAAIKLKEIITRNLEEKL